MLDNLNELRTLRAIVPAGSLSGAGRALGVSLAVVSKRLLRYSDSIAPWVLSGPDGAAATITAIRAYASTTVTPCTTAASRATASW